MASRKGGQEGDQFRVRPGAPKAVSRPGSQRFVAQVLKAVSKSDAKASGAMGGRTASTFGRGRVAAGMAGRKLGANARRVVIKSRIVVLKKVGAQSVVTHLRYIEREGTTRDGQRGQAYGADTDTADLRDFEERGRSDRHQFRFIVSVEDAVELEELRDYTRELMVRMEVDLETHLDWVAVDHWDTDNPHTHVVVRGRDKTGHDLIVARDYIAHGMRLRAGELATEWLGPRTEREIRESMLREVDQERWTSLDRRLQQVQKLHDGVVVLAAEGSTRRLRAVLIGRLQRLTAMGLAEPDGINRWRLRSDVEPMLRAMGERGDIVRTMQRALGAQQREMAVFSSREPLRPVIGRVVGKGLADELLERSYLVIDGIDGRAHYIVLPAGAALENFPAGAVVEARGEVDGRAVDKTIAGLAEGDLYRTDLHLTLLRAQRGRGDPQEIVAAHVRRLEALRRAGLVEHVAKGVWRVPADLPKRARKHDEKRTLDGSVRIHSHLPINQQIRAIGETWLDRQLIGGAAGTASSGFGSEVREALLHRTEFLVEQGLAHRRETSVVLARNLLGTLRERELHAAARSIAGDTGLPYRAAVEGQRVSGVYRRSVLLTSGRFAMLSDGLGFTLVPWKQVIEQRLGQHLTATIAGRSVTWAFSRQRGLAS